MDTARALGQSIFTEADDLAGLHEQVNLAVRCHFEAGQQPKVIRLHFVREEVISVCDLPFDRFCWQLKVTPHPARARW